MILKFLIAFVTIIIIFVSSAIAYGIKQKYKTGCNYCETNIFACWFVRTVWRFTFMEDIYKFDPQGPEDFLLFRDKIEDLLQQYRDEFTPWVK